MIQKLAMNHSDCMLENTQIKQQVKFLGTEIQRLSKKAIQHQEIVTKTLREIDALIQKQSEVNKKNFNKPFEEETLARDVSEFGLRAVYEKPARGGARKGSGRMSIGDSQLKEQIQGKFNFQEHTPQSAKKSPVPKQSPPQSAKKSPVTFVPRRSKRSTKMKTPAKFNNFIR